MSSPTSAPPAVRATPSAVSPLSRPLRVASRSVLAARAGWRLRPLSRALAVLALASGWNGAAHAQARAFSPGWFADKNAVQSTAQRTGRMPDGSLAGIGTSARQQAEARQQLRHSLDNLNRTAAAVAAQQAAQAAARAAAAANGGGVPDGLVEGGLWEARGAQAKWEGANAAKTSTEGGRKVVTIEQTQSRAILNWDTFNLGRNTTLRFQQNAADAVLNRVVGASARPSEIHGAIKADGTVLVVNQNGVIFTGTSQVNARNLVAAAATITDAQFRDKGIYTDTNGTSPAFKDALGQVQVLAGARIETAASPSATRGGGYVLLLGSEIHNAGTLATPGGQVALAAGDDFYIRKGYGTDGNLKSTTTGNEVSATLKAGSAAGRVSNSGLIIATTGDVTLTGRQVRQEGVLLATTDIGARGAIHLLNRASDTAGSITLGAGSVTAVLLEQSAVTGLDSQRAAAIKTLDGTPDNKTGGAFDNLSTVADRRDLSRIEVVSGNLATFQDGSTTLATGGQIAVFAGRQALLENGARLDVAGAIGVRVAMEANNLQINVQGNEQRDSPVNRDSRLLNSNDIWIDRRTLVKVASGTNGYAGDRWYTSGGLLEVGGYLVTSGRGAAEWLAQGGTATFTGGELVTRAGSNINLSGGTLDVQDGYIRQSWLRGVDGRLYEASRAPGDLLYRGLYKGFEQVHARWGENATRVFYNPLIAPQARFENGYTVGRDAGALVVATTRAQMAGAVTGEVYQGARQAEAPQWDLDGYGQAQNALARRGQLIVGNYAPLYDAASGALNWGLAGLARNVVVGDDPVDADSIRLDAAWLNAIAPGYLRLAGKERIEIGQALALAPGAGMVLYAPQVDINAGVSAPGGRIQAGNMLRQLGGNGRVEDTPVYAPVGKPAGVTLAAGAVLDVGGLWTNLSRDPSASPGIGYRNAGSVSLRSTHDVSLAAGSAVDASGGAAMLATGKARNGRGGDILIEAGAGGGMGVLAQSGQLTGHGLDGGGKLTLQAYQVRVVPADASDPAAPAGVSVLADTDFAQGFSQYDVIGTHGLAVASGARLRVQMPVQRYASAARAAQDKAQALQVWTPALYQEDPLSNRLTQRRGASLLLQAGTLATPAAAVPDISLAVADGAQLDVDPGQRINLAAVGQITLNGVLNAWGGRITATTLPGAAAEGLAAAGSGRSIWVGEHAVLDVAARAATAVNRDGQTYGNVQDGGVITLGSAINLATGSVTAPDLFVVLRPGSRLEASGAAATLLVNGTPTAVASAGGTIAVSSANGLYLDGHMRARGGAAGAANGTLSLALDTPAYLSSAIRDRVKAGRDFIVSQDRPADVLAAYADAAAAADSLAYGHATLSVGQLEQGGFGTLNLLANGLLSFSGDVTLRLDQGLRLFTGPLGMTTDSASRARVLLAAPYVMLAGATDVNSKEGYERPLAQPPSTDRISESVLRVQAGLIDIRDNVRLNPLAANRSPSGQVASYTGTGFPMAELSSRGDIRILGGLGTLMRTNLVYTTQLSTPGSLTLTAAQIYPETGAIARIIAGADGRRNGEAGYEEGSRIVIERSTASVPEMPYSAFGSLLLAADIIEQGGVLRAPLGLLQVGMADTRSGVSSRVALLPGSITSVSGRGMVLPYGGTLDGISYQYAGQDVKLTGQGAASLSGVLSQGMSLEAEDVRIQDGARVDVSGGGQLLGAGFVSGRGGSTDARFNPLVQIHPQGGGFTVPGLSTNPVYALVPGRQPAVAPTAPDAGQSQPQIGQQVTIGAGVPGLPAGTYTLMPATYALMPGAFRVEINGTAPGQASAGALALRNGSWSIAGSLGNGAAGTREAFARQLLVTSGQVLRQYSQYNEMDYAAFVAAESARRGQPRAIVPADARTLRINLARAVAGQEFFFGGQADFSAAAGGYGGTLAVVSRGNTKDLLEVTAPGAGRTAGFVGISLDSGQLNAMGAPRMVLGAVPGVNYEHDGNLLSMGYAGTHVGGITLRRGATLRAAEVFLVSSDPTAGIAIERGAAINTIGLGRASFDSLDGYTYSPGPSSMLAVSNGWLNVLPPAADEPPAGAGPIRIGVCGPSGCGGQAQLYTEGTLAAATNKAFDLDRAASYGARYLTLAVGAVNAGSEQALAAAAARGGLASGLTLDQSLLDRLMAGDSRHGAPALEMLTLAVADSFNFFDTVSLDTTDPATGRSRLRTLALTAPALYGYGQADDVATIRAGTLIWNGSVLPPAGVIPNGAGTGNGRLRIEAERIELGYGPYTQPQGDLDNARLALGFADVTLRAADRITANHQGTLDVYLSRGVYDTATGWQYSGGALTLETPLLTGEAGSVTRIKAGHAITLNPLAATAGAAVPRGLGAALTLDSGTLDINGRIALPTGKLALRADNALTLGAGAELDLAGRPVSFDDLTRYSWGGDVTLESRHGNIVQQAGSRIDLSARHNRAGQLTAIALDDNAGRIDLLGSILGAASGDYDAGGSRVPYAFGAVDIRAQLVDFSALNQRLNEGQVNGARSFQLKRGNLVIGDELRAREVNISVDAGSLTIAGRVDASGAGVGSIRLAARDGLRLAANAVLDTHGAALRVDSYGKIIDAPNRAMIELDSGKGTLQLDSGARIDLRAGTEAPGNDGLARGTLELNAPRLGGIIAGDIDIDARGPLDIRGARSIAVNGMWVYTDAPAGTENNAGGRPYQVIDQAYLNQLDRDSRHFIAALANGGLLQAKLAGLRPYADALHLRPGVEIRSATPDGDLVVQGDLDLSGLRYASVNPRTALNPLVYGSGEVGKLVLRAGGDLQIHGSINDGFAPPPDVPQDANGWRLLPGMDFLGGDMIAPHAGVTLAPGTSFPGGVVLNYAVTLQGATYTAGTVLPVTAPLAQPLTLAAGTVLSSAILNPDGSVAYAAGTVLQQSVTLPETTRLAAGWRVMADTFLGPVDWPAGIALPNLANAYFHLNQVKLATEVTLPRGGLIPSGTKVELPAGVDYVDLRPAVNGVQGQAWAIAPMLPQGSQSWSLRLAGGADLNGADTRATRYGTARGNLVLADSHYGMYGFDAPGNYLWTQLAADDLGMPELFNTVIDDQFVKDMLGMASAAEFCLNAPEYCSPKDPKTYAPKPATARFSVLRTGTGDLDLVAGGDVRMQSLFGVYTAGASTTAPLPGDPYHQARYIGPNGRVLADDDKAFDSFVDGGPQSVYRAWYPDGGGNLTIRAGANLIGDTIGVPQSGYARPLPSSLGYNGDAVGNWLWRQGSGNAAIGQAQPTAWWINFGTYASAGTGVQGDELLGFTGFGTLGGGNLTVDVGGNAGLQQSHGVAQSERGFNGRSQSLVLAVGSTGRVLPDGGLALTGGGDINLRVGGQLNPAVSISFESAGAVTNLRGQTLLQAASFGRLDPLYNVRAARDTRGLDRFQAADALTSGGLTLNVGDSAFRVDSLGDLAITAAGDPGRGFVLVPTPYVQADGTAGIHGSQSWFSLWTDHSAVDLFSAGGNVAPIAAPAWGLDTIVTYPSQLSAIAASGSIYYKTAFLLAPGPSGRLDLLAGQSIFGGDAPVQRSSASPDSVASVFKPAFVGKVQSATSDAIVWGTTNLSQDGAYGDRVLFAFGPDSAGTDGQSAPSRFYAMHGDLVGVTSGRHLRFGSPSDLTGRQWYSGDGPVRMLAGRDIVGSGSAVGATDWTPFPVNLVYHNNLFVHGDPRDVSVVHAGRDIIESSFTVAGPGTLEVTAGRNILMADKGALTSLGPVAPGDLRAGANIAVLAGLGVQGADYAGLLQRYLDPTRVADPGRPLTDQGLPFKSYESELLLWLTQAYGFAGNAADARAFFAALPAEQQRIFARQVVFAELRAGGREYNDKTSPRQGSYLRGRQAIAALFPRQGSYDGSITMYGGAGIQTRNGGDIQVLTPGGAQVYGVEGAAPPATAGVVTQGRGGIEFYARDSILLGQSRVMTTFGGDILAWSAQGDINAGRGSKTSVVYTPPFRRYDGVGNISLSPAAPATGAGIATLATLAEVPAGDVDLYAPLGTIDAGEAGIRVSGNVNIAARNVLNAANIKSKGDSVGIPVSAAVNTGALTSASAAASSAVNAAQDSAQRSQSQARQNRPSIIDVQILGYGAEPLAGAPAPAGRQEVSSYRPDNMVQVVGDGGLTPAQLARLSQEEKQAFGL